MSKDKDIHGLLKLPDEVVIKELRTELGIQNSYIAELEDELKRFKGMTPEELKEFKKEEVIKEKNNQINELQKQNKTFRKDNEKLIIKILNK